MKRVLQTKFGDDGNCLTASLASALGLDLLDIPEITQDEWWLQLEAVLLGKGFFPVYVDEKQILKGYVPKGTHLAGIDSPRSGLGLHSVVIEDGVIVWDPHPDQDGYGRPLRDITLLVKSA